MQPELKGERVQRHVAAAEAGLGYEPNKRLLRVGALLEHRIEDELDQGTVDHALATHVCRAYQLAMKPSMPTPF